MLTELRVENLLLIERAELRLAPGLNVLTGETGAGKTVLAHALDLLLGGRAKPGIVRPGAAEAYVEGVFELAPELRDELGERLPAGADEVVLARRIGADGRTRALVNGRSATLADLRELAEPLLTFYGQHEHRRLTLAGAQLEILDGFCGEAQLARRAKVAGAYAAARATRSALDGAARARRRARARDRPAGLRARRDRGGRAARGGGRRAARRARPAAPSSRRCAVPRSARRWRSATTRRASPRCSAARGRELASRRRHRRARSTRSPSAGSALAIEADDLAGELRSYAEWLDAEPGRLEVVEERLGGARPAGAQARRVDRGGARACRGVPPRGAPSSRARSWRWRPRVRGSPRPRRSSPRAARRCARRARRRRRSSRRRCARGSRSSR